MFWKTLGLAACAVLLCAAAPKAAPKAANPPKAPPAKAGAKATLPAFDARDPASLVALLGSAGAKAQVARKDEDAVLVTVESVAANFSVQFADCDRQGRACKAAFFDLMGGKASPPISQLNAFNQSSVMCRAYQDRSGKPHVVYSTLLFADDTRQHATTQLAAWQGCVGEFGLFLKDPNAYLASAP